MPVTIRMNTIYAGPRGNARPGELLTVPEGEAEQLVAGGYAAMVEPAPAEQQPEAAVEPTAASGPAEPAPKSAKEPRRARK